MNRKIFFLFGILIGSSIGIEAFSQDTLDNSIEQKLENLTENSQNEEEDYTELFRTLDFYRQHPINLNNTNTDRLSEMGLLDEIQIESLLSHIDKNGKLISVYELQSIDGFAIPTIKKILPYIKVADITEEPHTTLKEMIKKGNHEFILRGQQVLEEQTGFSAIDSAGICNSPNARYIGSPQKIYTRYRFSYGNNISAGITAEKDAGELFFRNNNKFTYPCYNALLQGKQKTGFDFYSAHLFIKNIRFVRTLAIGDYQVGFGQGLTSWSGIAYGKSSDAVNIKRISSGVRPYTSSDENRFMRGIALTAGTDQLQATGFFSRKKMDANITYLDSLNTTGVYSLQTTGLHSTPSEIEDKDAITQTVLGGNISFRKRKYSFGLTGMHTLFDAELNHSSSTYNQFDFSGKQLTNVGADYSFLIRNFNFFGELAVSSPPFKGGGSDALVRAGGLAVLNGCIVSLDPKLSFSLLHRNYQRNFQSLSSNAFSESTAPSNEQGFYFGISAKPTNSISINAYYDHFTFPWLKYQVSAPSSGTEYVIQINYTPSKKLDTYIRVKQKDKFVNSSSLDEIDFISPFQQKNYRWHLAYKISQSVKLSNRIEYTKLNKEEEEKSGYLIYQDATYKKMGSKISFTLRYALFDTESFDSRIYAYENDMPGSYSIPSYYNKGNRMYAMLNYNITRNLELWLRWSQTYYSNQSVISSGTLNEIQGRGKSEVKVQMRLKF